MNRHPLAKLAVLGALLGASPALASSGYLGKTAEQARKLCRDNGGKATTDYEENTVKCLSKSTNMVTAYTFDGYGKIYQTQIVTPLINAARMTHDLVVRFGPAKIEHISKCVVFTWPVQKDKVLRMAASCPEGFSVSLIWDEL